MAKLSTDELLEAFKVTVVFCAQNDADHGGNDEKVCR